MSHLFAKTYVNDIILCKPIQLKILSKTVKKYCFLIKLINITIFLARMFKIWYNIHILRFIFISGGIYYGQTCIDSR